MYSGAKSARRMANMSKQQQQQYSGGMTSGARKRLAKAITIMTQAVKPKWVYNAVTLKYQYHTFSFLTLTIASPKNITARQAYDNLLAPFLDWMRKTMQVKTYIWKAELQKRGQIHYHITTPAWIHHREIRNKWNALQRSAGLLDDYATEHGHFNPNSTDVHNTRNIRKMDQYLVKELAKSFAAVNVEAINEVNNLVARGELEPSLADEKIKEIEEKKITTIGKIWDCSNDLAGVGYFTIPLTGHHRQQILQWIKEKKAREKTEDFYQLVYVDDADPPEILSGDERTGLVNYLHEVMNRNEAKEAIPAACVQMDQVDTEETYTWSQMEIFLN
jgi:hypothetical protein